MATLSGRAKLSLPRPIFATAVRRFVVARSTIQVPAIRDTLELVHACVRKGESGACHQVLRLRDEYLGRTRQRRDACADRDGDAAHLVVDQLALACVDSCTDLDPEIANATADVLGASDRSCGTVETRLEAVACRVDLDATRLRTSRTKV